MKINDPEIVGEVEAAFAAYEAALMSDDVEALDALFWRASQTVRYGVGENLYGHDQIAGFRRGRTGGSPRRRLLRTEITTYGCDFATANAEFQREGAIRPGRQSQTWVRTADGWRVVSAHVSLLGEHS